MGLFRGGVAQLIRYLGSFEVHGIPKQEGGATARASYLRKTVLIPRDCSLLAGLPSISQAITAGAFLLGTSGQPDVWVTLHPVLLVLVTSRYPPCRKP